MPTHDTYLDNGTATGLTADTLNIPLARANVNKNVTFLLLNWLEKEISKSNRK